MVSQDLAHALQALVGCPIHLHLNVEGEDTPFGGGQIVAITDIDATKRSCTIHHEMEEEGDTRVIERHATGIQFIRGWFSCCLDSKELVGFVEIPPQNIPEMKLALQPVRRRRTRWLDRPRSAVSRFVQAVRSHIGQTPGFQGLPNPV